MPTPTLPRARLATQLAFLVAGFGLACWAPLIPWVKARLVLDDGVLGLLFLCMGLGSIVSMPLTGAVTARGGGRSLVLLGGAAMAGLLPLLAAAPGTLWLGAALALFGAALGALDVAMNVHAIEVERQAEAPLMSGFHAMFSVGGLAGSLAMTLLLAQGTTAIVSAWVCAAAMGIVLLIVRAGLWRLAPAPMGPRWVRPRASVWGLAVLAALCFLVEGALLDWGALLLIDRHQMPVAQSGMGYVVFSVSMVLGRWGGDALSSRWGDRALLEGGGSLGLAGFGLVLATPDANLALAGFALIGLGASNLVPVLFRRAGGQQDMPAAMAIAAVTTTAYAGVLAGPALLGMLARQWGLAPMFWTLAALLAVVPLSARTVLRR